MPKNRDEIVVFSIRRDAACAECGEELGKGQFLRMEGDLPLCLSCADLDRLVFLPSGTAALTRRASTYSTLRAVVVRFSRARGRYERQGVLVEQQALEKAEEECLADEEARAARRARDAERREGRDAEYVASFAERIRELFPGCPPAEREVIAEHACAIHSGRVGRSAAARRLEEDAVTLAVRAHVRHQHTRYDELLASGTAREESRAEVALLVERVLADWKRG
jgi:hypothetical protein